METLYQSLYTICKNNNFRSRITIVDPGIFMENAIVWNFGHDRGGWTNKDGYEVYANVDFHTHETYQVDIIDYLLNTHKRWINKNYNVQYNKNAFERQLADINSYGFPIMKKYFSSAEEVLHDVECLVSEESMTLELSDTELALIARAAHNENVTINEFINKVLVQKLNEITPDWRNNISGFIRS